MVSSDKLRVGGVAWDYEESTSNYYHVYAFDGPFDGFIALALPAPETPENTWDIQVIVDALNRIALRCDDTEDTTHKDE